MAFPAKSVAVATLFAIALSTSQGSAATQTGRASWYSSTNRTASGERCNPHALTAAHRWLPFGTEVRVHNVKNGRSITVRINDRGPYAGGRIIDLSKAAADRLGLIQAGTGMVHLTVLASR